MIEVSAAIIQKGNFILIAQRNRNKSQGLMWEFPGGKLEAGETAEASLVREIKEELNIHIEVGERFGENIYEYPSGKIKLIAFRAKWKAGELRLLEHENVKWVTAEELKTFQFAPADRPFVDKLTN